MAKRLQFRRLLMIAVLLVAAFAGLGYRLVDLQVLRHGELSAIAQQNTQREFVFEPRRGDILDCKGNLLATSISAKIVCADPTMIGNHQAEVARAIAPLLKMSESELYQELLPKTRVNAKGETVTNAYVRLQKRVSVETWKRIDSIMSKLPLRDDGKKLSSTERAFNNALREKAIFAENYPMRVYPNQLLAAHVIGFAGTQEREFDDHFIHQITGRDGIELTLNSKLSGIPGLRMTETDQDGREVISLRDQDVEPCDGLNVVLTIDSVVQHILESALADAMEKHTPVSACGIVVRPKTGEILAMATLPNYDPNNPGAYPAAARRNRVISDIMEPGSTFKIVVVSGALNDNIVRLDDVFNCEHGHFAFGGHILHDDHNFDSLSVKNIIVKSSNIGAAKIGMKMGEDELYRYITRFGFGERTGVPLPGEVNGIVHPVDKWSKISVAQIPMGQGVAVTRLQLVMAMSAIANGGWLMRPMLVDRLQDNNGNIVAKYSPQRVRQVVSARAAASLTEALKGVVTREGTAPNAAMNGYTAAGKTGTAQKVENGAYVHNKFVASFIGFFPAENPELCIGIILDDPKGGYYGGSAAGPVFKEVAERCASYLNIPSEEQEKNPVPETIAKMDANLRRATTAQVQ
jgi:cell division protein FtsI/penicillin-binding protein 2